MPAGVPVPIDAVDPSVLAVVVVTDPPAARRGFAGHPVLAWSIAAADQAELVDAVLVLSDDPGVVAAASAAGASTAPAPVGSVDSVLAAACGAVAFEPQVVVLLPASVPLRPRGAVDGAVRMLVDDHDLRRVTSAVRTRRPLIPAGPRRAVEVGDADPTGPSDHAWLPTGHVEVWRVATGRATEAPAPPPVGIWEIEPGLPASIDGPLARAAAEAAIEHRTDDFVRPLGPGRRARPLPDPVELVVLDFDGVLTDNRVWVDRDGRESIAANRGDGWGLARLREVGVEVVVLSTERDPVVAARCRKLDLLVEQGIDDKGRAIDELIDRRGVSRDHVVFVGNDVNDLPCFGRVAYAVAPSDAHPSVLAVADAVLTKPGGHGAVRELCDRLVEQAAAARA